MNAVFTEVAQKLCPAFTGHHSQAKHRKKEAGGATNLFRQHAPVPPSTLQEGWQLQYTTITQRTQKGEQSDEPETDETLAETTYCLSSGVRRRDG